MKINTKIEVIANCNKYETVDSKKFNLVEIKLELTKEDAMNFIFKSTPSVFAFDNYRVLVKYDDLNNIKGLALVNSNGQIFVVNNYKEFLNEIEEGYTRIKVIEKISSMMEFDFQVALPEDSDGIVDEFEE